MGVCPECDGRDPRRPLVVRGYENEKPMDKQVFWLVWNPDRGSPSFKHESKEAAIAEAERLARVNPRSDFFVLQAIGVRRDDSMVRVDFEKSEDDGIPF